MIKRQLNPLRIGKGLLCLLALFVMLLAPQGAWAEDYGLTVAGITVTEDNAGHILGDNNTTVTFAPASGTIPATLTLNEATISGNIIWTNQADLNVCLIGSNYYYSSTYPTSENPVFKGSDGALLFTTSETNPGSLYVNLTSEKNKFMSGWGSGSTPIWHQDNNNDAAGFDWWADQGCDFMTIRPNKKYDLKINGFQFCDAWSKQNEKTVENPTVRMINDNTLYVSGDGGYAIVSNMSALTVAVTGKTTMSSIRFESKENVTEGTLTITKYENSNLYENSLTLNNTKDNNPTISGFKSVNISDPLTLKTPTSTPTWNSYKGEVFISDYVSYGLTVGGIEVTDKNAGNIFNDGTASPSAVFDATNNKLTFNNINHTELSNTNKPFITNGYGNLIIHIIGTNNVGCGSSFLAKSGTSTDNYTVTFTTDETNRGSMSISTFVNELCTGHNVTFNNGLGWSISDKDPDTQRYIMTVALTDYALTVGGVSVNSGNATDIKGDNIKSGKVSYNSETNVLTLNGASITGSIAWSSTEPLTIALKGESSINGGDGYCIECTATGQNSPALSFVKASDATLVKLEMTFKTEKEVAINGFVVSELDDDVLTEFDNEGEITSVTTIYSAVKLIVNVNGEGEVNPVPETSDDGGAYTYGYGQTVYLIVNPEDNYALSKISAKTSNNENVALTEVDDEEVTMYSLTMPSDPVTVTATFGIDISNEDYTATIATATYSGEVLEPTTVTLIPEEGAPIELTAETDFTITGYQIVGGADGVSPVSAGEYTVTIEGAGDYAGTTTVSYTIGQADLASVEIASIADQEYMGSAIEPAVSVTLNGVTIDNSNNSEYTVSYSNNDAVGEATVTLTSTGKNFSAGSTKSATFNIVNPTLVVNDGTFHNGWATYYNANESFNLPEGVGAFVASGVNSGAVSVTQISSIPKGVPVLLSNVAANLSNTTEYVANTTPNLLKHADTAKEVKASEGDFYGLYDGTFMRVTGTISAGKNYLLNPAVIQSGLAPQLTIVIDGETTGVNDVRSQKAEVGVDLYDLQGRKVQKPSKKGLYIQKGHKVVINK